MATKVTLLLAASLAGAGEVAVTPQSLEFFERQVRPVLVANCISCHGSEKQESGLRLDSRDAILRGGAGGPVVEPGRPEASRIIEAVEYAGDIQMPPGGKLAAGQIAALRRWVELGAHWPATGKLLGDRADAAASHWAFRPVRKPAVPRADGEWVQTPIDPFIQVRLRGAGLGPSPRSGRGTLIRRAAFDLLGLPPTPQEIEAFEADPAPDAFERLVDRLLASPAHGERWGRHWLDLARYADDKGYVFFEDKQLPWAFTYRDYVVRSFNADLSFDRFVLEQLAADQLDLREDLRPLAALGFLTVGGHFMNNVHDIVDDRIDVVTRGLLGLSVTCARCHDHKYEPITQADYYALYGVFRSSYEPMLPPVLEPPAPTGQYRLFSQEMAIREQELASFLGRKHRELLEEARSQIARYLLAAHSRRGHPPADDFMLIVDKGDLNPTLINRWQAFLENASRHPDAWLIWRELAAVAPESVSPHADLLAGRLRSGDTSLAVNPLIREAFATRRVASMQDVAAVYEDVLKAVDRKWREALAQAREAGRQPPSELSDTAEEELRAVLYGPDSPADIPLAMDWGALSLLPDRPSQDEYKKLRRAVETWSATGRGAPPRAMVLADAPAPYAPHVFLRGNPRRPGESVPRRFPSLLDSRPFQRGSGRLELAQRIVDAANPLTARVLVNRVWLHHFGQGLVGTPSDFGLRGGAPSHPELLDWLAAQLVEDGWSMKNLHRRIMGSAVYQQESRHRPECARVDPENTLWWRMNQRRLEFEAHRDAMLAVAGQLDRTMGGPGLELFGNAPHSSRRTVYASVARMDVTPLLATFDFPDPAATSPQRSQTMVPPQALYFMNNPLVIHAARSLVESPQFAPLSDASKLVRIHVLLFGRQPAAAELQWAQEFLGPNPPPDRWVQLAHGLLMTNEFVLVD